MREAIFAPVVALLLCASSAPAAFNTPTCLAQKRNARGNFQKCRAVAEAKVLQGKSADKKPETPKDAPPPAKKVEELLDQLLKEVGKSPDATNPADPRLTLEVALVLLCRRDAGPPLQTLTERVERLEQAMHGQPSPPASPVERPDSGGDRAPRAALGALRRSGATHEPVAEPPPASPPPGSASSARARP